MQIRKEERQKDEVDFNEYFYDTSRCCSVDTESSTVASESVKWTLLIKRHRVHHRRRMEISTAFLTKTRWKFLTMQGHQLVNGRRRQPSGIDSNASFYLLYQMEVYTTSFGDSNIVLKRNDRHSRIIDKFTMWSGRRLRQLSLKINRFTTLAFSTGLFELIRSSTKGLKNILEVDSKV